MNLSIKVFADCADFASIRRALDMPVIKGFTTNPSLISQAGVANYTDYALKVLQLVPDMPVSFEVFSDDPGIMEKEARIIRGWGDNVYVKIPIVGARGESRGPLIQKLADQGIPLNVTAVFTAAQVAEAAARLNKGVPALVSVFAGRIADAGVDPLPIVRESAEILQGLPGAELLWASTRELYNIFQAEACGCRVITAPLDIIARLAKTGKDLTQCSIDAVRTFMQDIAACGATFN